MKMNKHGQAKLTLPRLLTIVMCAFVFLSILYAVIDIGNNEAYLRQLYVTKLGLELQAMQALGPDINAERDITDAGAYNLVFQSGTITTQQKGVATSTFLFTQVPELIFTGGEFYPEKGQKTIGPIKLFKTANRYGVARPDKVPSPYLLNCNAPKGNPLKQIATEGTPELVNSLRAGRPNIILDLTKGDAIIAVHTTSGATKAYHNKAGKRLACEILNAITKEYKIPVRPIPVNTDYFAKTDTKNILKENKPAVYIEIGPGDGGKQTAQIYNGIENYGVA